MFQSSRNCSKSSFENAGLISASTHSPTTRAPSEATRRSAISDASACFGSPTTTSRITLESIAVRITDLVEVLIDVHTAGQAPSAAPLSERVARLGLARNQLPFFRLKFEDGTGTEPEPIAQTLGNRNLSLLRHHTFHNRMVGIPTKR